MRLLDLFCGAGGASMGYHHAGFTEIVGVDIAPQPHYPFEFHQANALTYPLDGFDVIHASPPCQGYSHASACRPGLSHTYPRLIEPIRDRLKSSGSLYVIENVSGAKRELSFPIRLCGEMFGLKSYRHRFFEANGNVFLSCPLHKRHLVKASRAGHWKPETYVCVAGNCAPFRLAQEALGIFWMTRDELVEAIPPIFTKYIGQQLLSIASKS